MIERAEERPLLLLANTEIVVGVLPRIGGRVVLLRRPGGVNALLSNPARWSDEPTPAAGAEFVPYNGHITWVGPQSGWWTDQDVNPARRDAAAPWPPDPWLIYAPFRVEAQTPTTVRLVGPDSPVCGLRLTKEVELADSGVVTLRVAAQNIRQRPVTWDIWTNTRLPGDCPAFVPVEPSGDWRVEPADAALLHRIGDGGFTFDVQAASQGDTNATAKAFIHPARGEICAASPGGRFVKRAPIVPQADIHPEQAFIEVYQDVDSAGGPGLLELEMHSALQTLAPGESMRFEETWELTDGD
jgi:uncharacterized protein DUF4380